MAGHYKSASSPSKIVGEELFLRQGVWLKPRLISVLK